MQVLGAALAYFGLVFAAGFALGTVRVLVLVPRLGERDAELLETPLMLLVVVPAARLVVRRAALVTRGRRLTVGLVALGLLAGAEIGVVHFVRSESLTAYLDGRDPLALGVYLASLGVVALAPLAFAPREGAL